MENSTELNQLTAIPGITDTDATVRWRCFFFSLTCIFTLVLKGVIVTQLKKKKKCKIGSSALISAEKTKINTIFSGYTGYLNEQSYFLCILLHDI